MAFEIDILDRGLRNNLAQGQLNGLGSAQVTRADGGRQDKDPNCHVEVSRGRYFLVSLSAAPASL